MRYRKDYQETHDIDWFFIYQGKPYHAASNGSHLPDAVDSNENRLLQEVLEDAEGHFVVDFSEAALNRLKAGEDLSSFAYYASKGFISLDWIESEDVIAPIHYRIIAFPKNGAAIANEDLLVLLPELKEDELLIQ